MPRKKTTPPGQSSYKGQRSIELPDYLIRYLPQWKQPTWFEADMWRLAVQGQPIATVCRETLISNISALEWKIEPKDSTQRDELKSEIDYYTSLFEDNGEYDYVSISEWVIGDYLDIPFGSGVELGWEHDTPPTDEIKSRLMWYQPIDGGTLFPTRDRKWPVGQIIKENPTNVVYFPDYAINRLFMSPRSEMTRQGWGVAPPEKIYLALELLNRGDRYYANLLLDTPEVGILDLGDMEEESAKNWLDSWRDLLGGIDPFKIPVLYEHEKPATFVSFTRSPTELMFDKATMKYASIVTAGYGMSLSDIGISAATSGGDTLAGSIRQERKTRKTGQARVKNKVILFYNRMLPPSLRFKFIDLDDELSVALGRARLANATAFTALIKEGVFTPEETRQQIIADGLISISIPEALPEEAKQRIADNKAAERPSLLGRPIAPSDGGHGEVIPRAEMLEFALKDDDFCESFDILENAYELADDDGKNLIVSEMQQYLDDSIKDAITLDTDGMLSDNIID